MNNPFRYIDPNGMSTHTDSLGVVVAVYDDGDLNIYRYNNLPDGYAIHEGQTEIYLDEDGNEQIRESSFKWRRKNGRNVLLG